MLGPLRLSGCQSACQSESVSRWPDPAYVDSSSSRAIGLVFFYLSIRKISKNKNLVRGWTRVDYTPESFHRFSPRVHFSLWLNLTCL